MSENKVITVSAEEWGTMLILKQNIKALSSRNEEGKMDICLRKEKSFLRSYLRKVVSS